MEKVCGGIERILRSGGSCEFFIFIVFFYVVFFLLFGGYGGGFGWNKFVSFLLLFFFRIRFFSTSSELCMRGCFVFLLLLWFIVLFVLLSYYSVSGFGVGFRVGRMVDFVKFFRDRYY